MTSATVTVLYEDSRAPAQSFALHELVVAIVADRTARPESERWRLVRVIVSLPCNGNAKLRREAEDRRLGINEVFELVDALGEC